MEPNTISNYISIHKTKIVVGAILSILFLVGYLILTTPIYKQFSTHATPFRSTSYSQVVGDSIYSYNGMQFYKTALVKPYETLVLSSGVKLPNIEQLYWGDDQGVLLKFTDGGYIGSILEKKLTSSGMILDNITRNYIWYYHFADQSLSMVDTNGYKGFRADYDKEKRQFYFTAHSKEMSDFDDTSTIVLRSFSPALHSTTTLLQNAGAGIESVVPCQGIGSVCMIMRAGQSQKLVALKNNTTEVIIKPSFNQIIPTANPSVFLGIKNHAIKPGSEEDVFLEGDVYYVNISTNYSKKTGGAVNVSGAYLANTAPDNSFYIADPSSSSDDEPLHFFTGAKNIVGTFLLKDVSLRTDKNISRATQSISGPISFNQSGVTGYYSTDDHLHLITPSTAEYNLTKLPFENAQKTVELCADKYAVSYNFSKDIAQFKLNVLFNKDYDKNIHDFSACIYSSGNQFPYGYEFVFTGVDPVNGRYVTD